MKRIETADMTNEELSAKVTSLREELFLLRFKLATGQLESHSQIKSIKRNIARCLGAQTRRNRSGAGEAKA